MRKSKSPMTQLLEKVWQSSSKNKYVRGFATAIILFIVGYEALMVNINELDSLHHGLIFPAALAVRYGLFPNLDAFAQYGPLNPILQGNWLKITGVRVFDMQLFTLTIAILLALLIFFVCRKYIGNFTSGLIALGWFMTGPQGLPWASLPANLIILTAAFILVRNIRPQGESKNLASMDLIAGLLIAIGIFARIQTGLVFILVVLVLLNIDRKRAIRFAIGWVIGLISFISYLQANKAFIPFIDECIVWASKTLGLAEVQPISISYLFELSWFIWTALLLVIIITFLTFMDLRGEFSKLSKSLVVGVLTFLALLLGVVSNFNITNLHLTFKPLLLNPEYFAITASRKILFTLDFAPLLIFVSLGLFLIISRYRMKKKLKDSSKIALAFGFACLSQTFPISDSYHMWFLSPILISCIAILRAEFPALSWQNNLNIILIVLMAGLQLQTVIDLNKNRYSFKNHTLSGMKSSLATAPDLDETMNQLDRVIQPGVTRFICPDGIYSVSNGAYNSVDSNFVNWSSGAGTNSKAYRYIFLCRTTTKVVEEYAQKHWSPVLQVPFGSSGESFNVLLKKSD
jgi:hypothetical protein